MDEMRLAFPDAMASESSPMDEPERIASAIFGPTPLTCVSLRNISRSSFVAKPKSISSSSRTQCHARSFASPPSRGRRSKVETGMRSS